MRPYLLLATVGTMLAASCATPIKVTTTVSPDAALDRLRAFRILTPTPRSARETASDDPMLVNSISNQVLRTAITDAFISRGYRLDPGAADFTIAYYATSKEKLDVARWDYGYRGRWGGWREPEYTVTPYTVGTVIIDVVNPTTHELLWRGRGAARTTDDPAEFQKNLLEAVQAIGKKFPEAKRQSSP
jgi:hypothetical protein